MNELIELQYGERAIDELDFVGGYYSRHVSAMTAEGLNSKSAIAAELAVRDFVIDNLKNTIKSLQENNVETLKSLEQLSNYLLALGIK